MQDLTGKVVVTVASLSIGTSIALLLAEQRAVVYVTGRTPSAEAKVLQSL